MYKAVLPILFGLFLFAGAPLISDSGISKAYAAETEDLFEDTKSDYEYFEMDPLLIPVITPSGLSQQISLVVSIEVPKGKLDDVKLYRPRLADAYIQDLYGVLGAGYGMINGNVLNVHAIKGRLSDVTVNVLGKENVNDVLLQVVQQRPL